MIPIQNILNEPMLEWGVFTFVFPMAQFSSLAFCRMAVQLSGVAAGSSLARNARMLYLYKSKRKGSAHGFMRFISYFIILIIIFSLSLSTYRPI